MESDDHEAATVRPYVVTGGRVGVTSADLPLETLIIAPREAPRISMSPEKRAILEQASRQYISLAELSAHIRLPIGVIRVLVADLEADGLVSLHREDEIRPPISRSGYQHQSPSMSVLESVLDGISVL